MGKQVNPTVEIVQKISVNGKTPRDFTIDESGSYAVSANQDSNNLSVFKVNKKTGLLEFMKNIENVEKPNCIFFTSNYNLVY